MHFQKIQEDKFTPNYIKPYMMKLKKNYTTYLITYIQDGQQSIILMYLDYVNHTKERD